MSNYLKPIDRRSSTCSNISSECVIWDGPDIPCIDLCKGDSIEKVVYELAQEVCRLVDLLNLNGIDTSCLFDTNCKPKTFEELLQYIVLWMCQVNNQITDLNNNQFTCDKLSQCKITFTDCNNQQQQYPLFSNDTNNVIVYLIGRICDLYAQINNINTSITEINNQITNIWQAINNLGGSMSFPSFNPNNCISSSTISTMVEFVQYVNNIAQRICDLAVAIGFTSYPFTTSSYTYTCDRLNILNVTVNNLIDLYNFFNTFFNELCTLINNISTSITDINNQINIINNTLNTCGCDCPKNVYPALRYHYTYTSSVYSFDIINMVLLNQSQLNLLGWNVTSLNIDAILIIDNLSITTVNSSPINTGSMPYSIDLSTFTSALNSYGCHKTINRTNSKLSPDKDIRLDIYFSITLNNGTKNCISYHNVSIPLKHCVCGYVENIEFAEGVSLTR